MGLSCLSVTVGESLLASLRLQVLLKATRVILVQSKSTKTTHAGKLLTVHKNGTKVRISRVQPQVYNYLLTH